MLHRSHLCMMLQMQGTLVQLQQQAAALQSQQQRGFTASARDVAGLQAQLSAVAQRQQQQLYTDEATAAATAAAAARTGSSSSLDSRSGAGAMGARKDELQRQVSHGPSSILLHGPHLLCAAAKDRLLPRGEPSAQVPCACMPIRVWMNTTVTTACEAVCQVHTAFPNV